MLLIAVGGSCFAVKERHVQKQRAVVKAIREMGGGVIYDFQCEAMRARILDPEPPGPAWLRRFLGNDFFAHVEEVVWLGDSGTPDDALAQMADLTRLKSLCLNYAPVTNAGLKHIAGLTQLETVSLEHTQVNDVGLERLKGLTQLKYLNLSNTSVTDAGLEMLTGLSQLEHLALDKTDVTDVGVEYLKGLTQLEWLGLSGTKVTDSGLKKLTGLIRLEYLDLHDTLVTWEGVEKLHEALPNCEILHMAFPPNPGDP